MEEWREHSQCIVLCVYYKATTYQIQTIYHRAIHTAWAILLRANTYAQIQKLIHTNAHVSLTTSMPGKKWSHFSSSYQNLWSYAPFFKYGAPSLLKATPRIFEALRCLSSGSSLSLRRGFCLLQGSCSSFSWGTEWEVTRSEARPAPPPQHNPHFFMEQTFTWPGLLQEELQPAFHSSC